MSGVDIGHTGLHLFFLLLIGGLVAGFSLLVSNQTRQKSKIKSLPVNPLAQRWATLRQPLLWGTFIILLTGLVFWMITDEARLDHNIHGMIQLLGLTACGAGALIAPVAIGNVLLSYFNQSNAKAKNSEAFSEVQDQEAH